MYKIRKILDIEIKHVHHSTKIQFAKKENYQNPTQNLIVTKKIKLVVDSVEFKPANTAYLTATFTMEFAYCLYVEFRPTSLPT